jgi:hypothetical protein
MHMPGYTAEASLYKTRRLYRGRRGTFGVNTNRSVTAALDCHDECLLKYFACEAGCLIGTSGLGLIFCIGGCAVAAAECGNQCPSDGGGGGGGSLCCPVGTSCRCGGRCVNVNGQLRCVDGMCLRPNQQCP